MKATTMDTWQRVWRQGIAPELPRAGLEALAVALAADDAGLMQGATTSPPPLAPFAAAAVTCCCPVSFTGWKGAGLKTVAQLERFFWEVCQKAEARLGEPSAARFFLNWWDVTPRQTARIQLLAEVESELARRRQADPWETMPHRLAWSRLMSRKPSMVAAATRKQTTFRIVFEIGPDSYAVAPMHAHPEVALKAYRFRKLTGAGDVYDVRQTEEFTECDCKGFERWRKPCKHIRTLQAAGMLPL